MSKRFSAWGFATWADKFDPFGFDVREHGVEEFLSDSNRIKEFCLNGEDLHVLLMDEYRNKLDALDVKVIYFQFVKNMFTVYPVKSLVQNTGFDGSGLHCGSTNKFDHDDLWGKLNGFVFNKDIQLDKRIRKEIYKFYDFKRNYGDNLLIAWLRRLKVLLKL